MLGPGRSPLSSASSPDASLARRNIPATNSRARVTAGGVPGGVREQDSEGGEWLLEEGTLGLKEEQVACAWWRLCLLYKMRLESVSPKNNGT